MQVNSNSNYSGWVSSGVSLDTRYAFGLFDSFTVNAGNSGLANGQNVQLSLSLEIQASAQTDGRKFQTASNFLDFTLQRRDPNVGAFGAYSSDQLFSLDYDVTVYDFVEKAVINGITEFDRTTTYEDGQGNQANVYNFDITLDASVGETIELGMLIGDFNPNNYNYDINNLLEGSRQDIGSSQEDYGNQFSFLAAWDFDEVEGFEGLEISSASGFDPLINQVPEPSHSAALLAVTSLAGAIWRRNRWRN